MLTAVRPINKKITSAERENLVERMLAGELTRAQAAKIAGVTVSSVTNWLEKRNVKHLVPRGSVIPILNAQLRARLTAHLLAGEITRSEAAQLIGASTGVVVRWPELGGVSAYDCRDRYLRKLLPDLMEGRKSVFHPPPGIKT